MFQRSKLTKNNNFWKYTISRIIFKNEANFAKICTYLSSSFEEYLGQKNNLAIFIEDIEESVVFSFEIE